MEENELLAGITKIIESRAIGTKVSENGIVVTPHGQNGSEIVISFDSGLDDTQRVRAIAALNQMAGERSIYSVDDEGKLHTIFSGLSKDELFEKAEWAIKDDIKFPFRRREEERAAKRSFASDPSFSAKIDGNKLAEVFDNIQRKQKVANNFQATFMVLDKCFSQGKIKKGAFREALLAIETQGQFLDVMQKIESAGEVDFTNKIIRTRIIEPLVQEVNIQLGIGRQK